MTLPTISIITPVINGAATIAGCLQSVCAQIHPVEHIVVDGNSTDHTLDVVKHFPHVARTISESDHGIYDAMNKGISLAAGEIIGILNADDVYMHPRVVGQVATVFRTADPDLLFADLVYVRPDNLAKVVRYYSGAGFSLRRLAAGWMPPHPTIFIKKACYRDFGVYKTDYQIAADFELLVRFLYRYRIRYHYLPAVLVKMRTGGRSTLNWRSNVLLNREVRRACAENGLPTSYVKIYSKYLRKLTQLVRRPARD